MSFTEPQAGGMPVHPRGEALRPYARDVLRVTGAKKVWVTAGETAKVFACMTEGDRSVTSLAQTERGKPPRPSVVQREGVA